MHDKFVAPRIKKHTMYVSDPMMDRNAAQPMLDYWELGLYVRLLGWLFRRVLRWSDASVDSWRGRIFLLIACRYWEIGDCYVNGEISGEPIATIPTTTGTSNKTECLSWNIGGGTAAD